MERDADDEVIVEVGAEGASLALRRRKSANGDDEFYVEMNQVALYDTVEELDGAHLPGEPVTRSRPATTFEEGLVLLDRLPDWPALYPVHTYPELSERVLAAVE